jgi:hypothetical protein
MPITHQVKKTTPNNKKIIIYLLLMRLFQSTYQPFTTRSKKQLQKTKKKQQHVSMPLLIYLYRKTIFNLRP